MSNIWFASDLHLGHANIIKYSKRPFKSVDEHDRILIENWNTYVSPRDTVYYLGDFAYKNKEAAIKYRERLAGQIFFIEGNHDSVAEQMKNQFGWYKEVYTLKTETPRLGKVEVFMSHYAHRVWNKSHHGRWHLYGHSHASLPDDPNSLSFDVGVDNTAMRLGESRLYGTGQLDTTPGVLRPENYRPISIDEVAAVMKTKAFKPIDHHGKDRH